MLEAAGSKAELVTLGGIESGVGDLGDGQLLVVGDGGGGIEGGVGDLGDGQLLVVGDGGGGIESGEQGDDVGVIVSRRAPADQMLKLFGQKHVLV